MSPLSNTNAVVDGPQNRDSSPVDGPTIELMVEVGCASSSRVRLLSLATGHRLMISRRCHVITWPLLVGVLACNGGELSRSHAAKELAARFNGSVGSLRVFRTKCVEKYFEKYPIRFIEDAQLARQYRSLEDAGLATQFGKPATSEQCGTPYPESLRSSA